MIIRGNETREKGRRNKVIILITILFFSGTHAKKVCLVKTNRESADFLME